MLAGYVPSRPARALWIEIPPPISPASTLQSRPARALWIEMGKDYNTGLGDYWSRPARALWIEISKGI